MTARISKQSARVLGLLKVRSARARREARTHHDRQEVRFIAPITPKTKSRARTFYSVAAIRKAFLLSGGSVEKFLATLKAQTITPTETRAFERAIAEFGALAMKGAEPFDCPVEIDLVFILKGDATEWPVAPSDGDLDNHKKAVLDALKGVVITDDRLVVRSRQIMVCGPNEGVYCACRPASPDISDLTVWVQRQLAGDTNGRLPALGSGEASAPAASGAW